MLLPDADIGIEKTAADLIIKELNHILADEHVLLVKTRVFHWNVRAMQFTCCMSFLMYNTKQLLSRSIKSLRESGCWAAGHWAQSMKCLSKRVCQKIMISRYTLLM